MSVKESLRKQFPQITIATQEIDIQDDKSMVEYGCAYHGEGRKETLKKLKARSYSCSKCASLLNKGHAFNLNKKPLEAKKIIEVSNFFHGRFDYSKFLSEETFTPSTVICNKHGDFNISLIDHVMLKDQAGCPQCLAEMEGKAFTIDSKPVTEKDMLASSLELAAAKKTSKRRPSQLNATVTTGWLQDAKKLFTAVPSN